MKSALFLILSYFLLDGFGEQTQRPEVFYRVVPVSGVNLREQPKLDSRIIITIPFAEQISTSDLVKYDTTIDNRNGNWIKAKYKTHSGYIFSGFIEDYKYVEKSSINSFYRLQPEGLIIKELSYDPELNWYGLYHNTTSDLYELKNVEVEIISYKSTVGSGICANLSIVNTLRIENLENPGFFIGSSNNLNLGLKNTSRTTLLKCLSNAGDCSIPFDGINYSILLEDFKLKITNGHEEQLLISGISESTFLRLEFAEDIDGDNKLDLILNVFENTGDGSQGGTYYMFLSSMGKDKSLVELVSTYNWSTGGCD